MKTETITEKLRRTKSIDNEFDYRRAKIRREQLETIEDSELTNEKYAEFNMLDDCIFEYEKVNELSFI